MGVRSLFTDNLYMHIGKTAILAAERIKNSLLEHGYQLYFNSPTNQVFVVIENTQIEMLSKRVEFGFWEKYDDAHTVIRFATNWATTKVDVDKLLDIIAESKK